MQKISWWEVFDKTRKEKHYPELTRVLCGYSSTNECVVEH